MEVKKKNVGDNDVDFSVCRSVGNSIGKNDKILLQERKQQKKVTAGRKVRKRRKLTEGVVVNFSLVNGTGRRKDPQTPLTEENVVGEVKGEEKENRSVELKQNIV